MNSVKNGSSSHELFQCDKQNLFENLTNKFIIYVIIYVIYVYYYSYHRYALDAAGNVADSTQSKYRISKRHRRQQESDDAGLGQPNGISNKL